MRVSPRRVQIINRLDAEQFDRLQRENSAVTRNAGTGLDAKNSGSTSRRQLAA